MNFFGRKKSEIETVNVAGTSLEIAFVPNPSDKDHSFHMVTSKDRNGQAKLMLLYEPGVGQVPTEIERAITLSKNAGNVPVIMDANGKAVIVDSLDNVDPVMESYRNTKSGDIADGVAKYEERVKSRRQALAAMTDIEPKPGDKAGDIQEQRKSKNNEPKQL